MSGDLLVVENIGKAYFRYSSEIKRFARWFGVPTQPSSESWVLRHVGFRVRAGESVGIIGQNGAGKSTLLKLVAGTARPNEGRVWANGSVSALLELGLGFAPELSGRANARHAAGLMGLSQADIATLMPSIEEFAEIGEYFDQPMRTYSSGMQMRVAFSVATAVKPDLLIVDEALSVGDAYFVHKSFQRMRSFREAGSSLLVVSHDAGAIQTLCDRAILLEQGRIILDGSPSEVLDYYNALIAERENSTVRTVRREAQTATESGTGEATFEAVQLLNSAGQPVEYVEVGQHVQLRARVRIGGSVPRLVFGYMLRDRLGQAIFGTNTHHTENHIEGLVEGDRVEFVARFRCDLGPGTYSVSVALHSAQSHLVKNYHWKDLALIFTVANADKPTFVGCAYIPAQITWERAASAGALMSGADQSGGGDGI